MSTLADPNLDSDRSGHDTSDHPAVPSPDLHRSLAETDPEVAAAIAAELHRQQTTLEMIACENFAPVAVMQAQGSVLTNKYAEGYPGRRYYGGCEHVDVIEQLAIDRLKALFGAEYANVQPHSGAQANAAAMAALLKPGDTILGLDLAHGGHLTHGMQLNFSGKLYDVVAYHVGRDDHRVDMDEVERLAREHQPEADHRRLVGLPAAARLRRVPADRRRGRRLPDGRHGALRRAWSPRACTRHPVPHAHVVTSTTHKTLGGPRGGVILADRRARQEDQLRGLPRPAGRPAGARHRGQGGGLQARGRAGVPGAPGAHPGRRPDPRRAAAAPTTAARPGSPWSPAAPTCTWCWSTCATRELDGQQAEDRLHAIGITVNRNAVPVRPAAADGHLRPAHRHPGAGHPRLRRRRLHRGRRHHRRRRCSRRSTTSELARLRARVTAPRRPPPALPGPAKGGDRPMTPRAPPAPTCPSTPTSSGATPSRRAPTTS